MFCALSRPRSRRHRGLAAAHAFAAFDIVIREHACVPVLPQKFAHRCALVETVLKQ